MLQNALDDPFTALKHTDGLDFDIYAKELGFEVGRLSFNTEDGTVFFEVFPLYQKKHYACRALYLYDAWLHEQGITDIKAVIDMQNEQARHVVEHNGYQLISDNGTQCIYVHRTHITTQDDSYSPCGLKVLYFAGGCFWGTERVFQQLDGVRETKVGYANGHINNPSYEQVCRNDTGFRETVRVAFDPDVTSIDTVLRAFFLCIDPTVENAQGNDHGSQYQTGIYYRDETMLPVLEKKYEEEKAKHAKFFVELKRLECFYEAEEYHQDYLIKNPNGYCHISLAELQEVKKLNNH